MERCWILAGKWPRMGAFIACVPLVGQQVAPGVSTALGPSFWGRRSESLSDLCPEFKWVGQSTGTESVMRLLTSLKSHYPQGVGNCQTLCAFWRAIEVLARNGTSEFTHPKCLRSADQASCTSLLLLLGA